MKDSLHSTENIVLFPQGGLKTDKNLLERESKNVGTDPLNDLLHEFEDIAESIENEEAKEALARVVERMQLPEELLAQEFSRSSEIRTKMRLLEEVNQRIKYYLDEVELFIPKRKK
jgi:hypothetical protein